MASHEQHINQAKRNLNILGKINNSVTDSLDWQVTVCFYTCVHLINAYLAQKANLHYKTHDAIDKVLNPHGPHPLKLAEKEYLAYEKLRNLSRRSRYLCHDDATLNNPEHSYSTTDKHLLKAIKQLDHLLSYITQLYGEVKFEPIKINCKELSASDKFTFIQNPFAPAENKEAAPAKK